MAVNKTKKEYFNAWDLGGGAKLWEWCANKTAGVLPYLLRKSDDFGGGDIPANGEKLEFAGRWAGDEVYMVGDYDSSNLWDEAKKHYTNIAERLIKEYNKFIEIDSLKLKKIR